MFRGLSIAELSIFMLLRLDDLLVEHYVDYTQSMSKEEIKSMLQRRMRTKETTYEKYEAYLRNPTLDARKSILLPQSAGKAEPKSTAPKECLAQ